jgi:hypothetical protein
MGSPIRRIPAGVFLFLCAALPAQTAAPASQTSAPVQITFGQAAAALNGPWKFTVGDSPIDPKTGQPLWAEPEFDDSKWETVDLTPKEGATDPFYGQPGYVPGWSARGHAGYWGYAWYRIRVQAQRLSGQPLALAGPDVVDDGYQAFSDGELVGSFGKFTGGKPVTYYQRPVLFRLPERQRASSHTYVIAFRLWMNPETLVQEVDAGGMHTAPLLGQAGIVALYCQTKWDALTRAVIEQVLLGLLFGLLASVAVCLVFLDRSEPVYFWIGIVSLVTAFFYLMVLIGNLTELFSITQSELIATVPNALILPLWAIVWWTWFGRVGFRWLPRALIALTALWIVCLLLSQEIFFGLISHHAAQRFFVIGRAIAFATAALLVWLTADGIRRRGLEGWLVLPVVLLEDIGAFEVDLARLHLPLHWFPFGIPFDLSGAADVIAAAAVAILLLRRLVHSVRQQRQMALDVKSAQEVQQVILPEQRVALPGFQIESEYCPAFEVGGDFFQIIPNEKDGSLLIVAGDVAGKGLKAGMLVALLVGAIRSTVEEKPDPAAILAALNRRLMGRGDARATCLALRIAADGTAKLANAGHPPPYLNGSPVEIEGSLPLGVIEKPNFSVLEFQVGPGDRLLLLSDGIAEATDDEGRLFGFERVLELVRAQPSAREIAETALAFGQEDDISVISVARVPVAEPALA